MSAGTVVEASGLPGHLEYRGVLFRDGADIEAMEVFEGTVRLAGDSNSLQAVMLVADNRLKVKTSKHEIGDWELTDLYSRIRPDGCHIVAEGEELIVSVDEPKRFAEAIGPSVANPGDGSLLRKKTTDEEHALQRGLRQLGVWVWAIPTAGKTAIGVLLVASALFVIAPAALVALSLLVGLVGLLVGGYALMDPFMAVRLPEPLNPPLLIRAGSAALVLAIVLALLI
jgi:hypothetical protein